MMRQTILSTDWSKDGVGYIMSQKTCKCEKINLKCCDSGWSMVLVGSRFCSGAESRYAPVEGETLAIVWALNNLRHYTLGNKRLTIMTDHKPLVKLFGDRKL